MSTIEAATAVPDFNTAQELRDGLAAKSAFSYVDLYPRDGSKLLGEVEGRVAELAQAEDQNVLVYHFGMNAVCAAIDTALDAKAGGEKLPQLSCSRETYSQTMRYLENFIRSKRAVVRYFDSGDPESVEQHLERFNPDIIVAETISNYVNVPVLQAGRLIENSRQADNKPVVILDNTLPLSTKLPISEYLEDDDKVIVVESGTKSYTRNRQPLGIAYTPNGELHETLLKYRRTRGDIDAPEKLEKIAEILPSKQDFDERNRRLHSNTGVIAVALAEHLADDKRFVVSHPTLEDHASHEYYREQYPDEASPILYVQSYPVDQFEVVERLWRSSVVREQASLGQSFGFDEARIVPDEHVSAVRISGGAEIDAESFGKACAEAILKED